MTFHVIKNGVVHLTGDAQTIAEAIAIVKEKCRLLELTGYSLRFGSSSAKRSGVGEGGLMMFRASN